MTLEARQLVLDQLVSSEVRLLALTAGLTPEEWHFHEAPERWSIAQIIEHVIVFENFIRGVVIKTLAGPAESDKMQQVAAKEPLVLGLAQGRNTEKFKAREAAQPTGRWPDTQTMLAEFHKTRAETVEFVRRTFIEKTQADLRSHFFPHVAYGDLDCYQWLVVMAQHGFRHALQIEEIKANPAYPVGG